MCTNAILRLHDVTLAHIQFGLKTRQQEPEEHLASSLRSYDEDASVANVSWLMLCVGGVESSYRFLQVSLWYLTEVTEMLSKPMLFPPGGNMEYREPIIT